MKEERNPYRAHLYRRKKTKQKQNTKNDTKSHTLLISHYQLVRYESSCGHKIEEVTPKQIGDGHGRKKRKEGRQMEAGVEVACRGHHRQEGIQEGKNQGKKTKQTRATTYNMRRARKATIYIYK